MKSKIKTGLQILTRQGLKKLLKEVLQQTIYKSGIKKSYSLEVNGVTVEFSAPSYSAIKMNKQRYSTEYDEIKEILESIQHDDVFYDIGANTGLYTLFIAQKCNKVISFEPYPPNINILKRDIQRNSLSNVDVVDIALSNTKGYIEFEEPAEITYGYGSAAIVPDETTETITVPTISGDKLIKTGQTPNPNIVKIDVEGAESLVIDGLKNTLSRSECRLVFCEIHLPGIDKRPSIADFNKDASDIKQQLNNCGFTVEEIDTEARKNIFLYKGYK